MKVSPKTEELINLYDYSRSLLGKLFERADAILTTEQASRLYEKACDGVTGVILQFVTDTVADNVSQNDKIEEI